MHAPDGLEIITCEDADAMDAWLAAHGQERDGVWIMIAKKASGLPSVTASEAIDVALCHGWIDGQRRGHDETHFLQKYTPRRPRSLWSQVNVDRVEALLAAGRMRERGLAQVDAAKADGRWAAAYPAQRDAEVPDDLAAALAARPELLRAFEALGKTERFLLYLPMLKARTPERRAAHLDRALRALGSG